ncbi:hypothetical protein C5708_15445 [Caulobacter sp. CCUG 60055]|uniref:hypothetical protein n=1 Tax=Caulobacter sp. CCUG 60055 TaxID=2100090 RepID=UPI001FA6CD4B|nr:hypothetical protein [Caulobacter sp. CCUG 60055]MBQ1541560.1 hypothetical protein [Caulobacteraceae bacterium]MCI3181640.1 hypothetical protein [Caulobacter sp. CCUG 60055]
MLAGVGGVGALGLGVAGLRRAWSHADRARPWFISAGWLLAALGLAAWCAGPWRADKAIALGVLGFSCLGGAAAAAGFERRTRKAARVRAEPAEAERPAGRLWRTTARTLLAGPLSGGLAVGVCLLIVLRAPIPPIDRLVLGGLAAPAAWAAAGVWSLTGRRLGRIALGLGAASTLVVGLALLP